MRETDLCRLGAAFLLERGYEVAEEAEDDDGTRADLVGRKGRALWHVEAKAQMGARVVAQALRHVGKGQRVSVLVPSAPPDWAPILDRLGLGLLTIGGKGVVEAVTPRVRPPAPNLDYRPAYAFRVPGGAFAGSSGAPRRGGLYARIRDLADNAPPGGAYLADHLGERELAIAGRLIRQGSIPCDHRGTGVRLRVYPAGFLGGHSAEKA